MPEIEIECCQNEGTKSNIIRYVFKNIKKQYMYMGHKRDKTVLGVSGLVVNVSLCWSVDYNHYRQYLHVVRNFFNVYILHQNVLAERCNTLQKNNNTEVNKMLVISESKHLRSMSEFHVFLLYTNTFLIIRDFVLVNLEIHIDNDWGSCKHGKTTFICHIIKPVFKSSVNIQRHKEKIYRDPRLMSAVVFNWF